MEQRADIEVFIHQPPGQSILSWVADRLGSVRLIDTVDDITFFKAESGAMSVIINPGIEGGPFTSVRFVGNALPWPGRVQCARDAAQVFSEVVRCAPEDQGQRDLWLELSHKGETLVPW